MKTKIKASRKKIIFKINFELEVSHCLGGIIKTWQILCSHFINFGEIPVFETEDVQLCNYF